MPLVADYGDSSSTSQSSSDEETIESNKISELPAPKQKLPTPDFVGGGKLDGPVTSVFKNPFTEEENKKEAILQKHVKMVDTKDAVMINGRRICWNYRKGKCRFGHNCKYAHDSDLQKSDDELKKDKEEKMDKVIVCKSYKVKEPSQAELDKIRNEAVKANKQRKKRPGLTEGLVPGKRVMKNYTKQKM